MDKIYQLDTGWGCGAVTTSCDGTIKETPPIFKKLIGKNINWIGGIYKIEYITTIDNEMVERDFFDD